MKPITVLFDELTRLFFGWSYIDIHASEYVYYKSNVLLIWPFISFQTNTIHLKVYRYPIDHPDFGMEDKYIKIDNMNFLDCQMRL